jgi:hypothetical protein
MLFHTQKALGKNIAAVIIDEGFWQDGLRIATHGVLLGDMESTNSPHPKASLLEVYRKRLVEALRRQPELGGVEPQHFDTGDFLTNVNPDLCTEAISMEYEVLEKVKMYPGMSPRELKRIAKQAPALRRARQMHAIWASVRELLENPDIGASGHIVLDKNKDGERLVKYRGVGEVCQQWQSPTLILDATLPDDLILQAYYPLVERVANLKVDMPHVFVRQVLQAPVSAKKLIHAEKDFNRKAVRRYILQRWIETGRQDTLVICQQKYEEWLKTSSLPAGIAVEHFNNIEGLDRFKDVRLLILIGRTIPRPEAVETYAGALTGVQPVKANNGTMDWYERVVRGIHLADGGGVAVNCDLHPDPTGEAVRWQICEGQLVQAIGRGRGVNRTAETPLDVDIVADVVVPITVNEAANWEAPSEVFEMLVEGIALTSPVDMVKARPDVWANTRAADRSLELLYRSMSRCSGAKGGTPRQSLIESLHKTLSWCSCSYQPCGPRMKRRTAAFDPVVLPDPCAWLESRLGPLAFFEIDAP